ncbi:pPIWI_RE module domain-containing protein, partial [Spirulina sp. 06S082]|uniref:pPIWI_RE module domain-containing protein n=1 Tax=Spirulina sp. 06S082 TaxID=3110248 RepID=UPI002B1F2366
MDNKLAQTQTIGDKSMDITNSELQKYVKLGDAKSKRRVPLAFTIPNDIEPVTIDGFIIYWTKDAIEVFSKIKPKKKNLPYVWLRGLIEVSLPQISRIDLSMGLYRLYGKPQPFAFLEDGEKQKIEDDLYPLLDNWIIGCLKPYAEKEEVDSQTIECLENLYAERKLVVVKPIQSQILPWSQYGNGSTKGNDNYSFFVLVDYIARQIAGREIFQG